MVELDFGEIEISCCINGFGSYNLSVMDIMSIYFYIIRVLGWYLEPPVLTPTPSHGDNIGMMVLMFITA